jgi:LmbE family N-acetylglucosaminyl deacetylase
LTSQPEIGVRLEPDPSRAKRIVVLSPHLDDAVLSLGAAIASWAREGARVEVLTVFACDPDSNAPTGGWDRRGGFATEGEAARARREEDRRACAILGATPVWLPFGSVDFERHGDEVAVRAAVHASIEGADTVLLPGAPLSHPDHAWLTRALAGDIPTTRLGFYAEQPYARRTRGDHEVPEWLAVALGTPIVFEKVPTGRRSQLAKSRAIRKYRSQLPLLGMRRSLRKGPHALALVAEAIALIDGSTRRLRD